MKLFGGGDSLPLQTLALNIRVSKVGTGQTVVVARSAFAFSPSNLVFTFSREGKTTMLIRFSLAFGWLV
jgi:hypothetical protein